MTDWRQYAACRGINPEVFYPPKGDPSLSAAALRFCRQCIVRRTCLDYANTSPVELDGVWGGMVPRDRRRDRVRRGLTVRRGAHAS
jgi:WhiB family redox-sensing transcriptional regulator